MATAKKPKPKTKNAQVKIDKDIFEKLCGIQCTLEELCAYFMVSEDTVERWCKNNYNKRFADIYKEKRGTGRVSLRRRQFQKALDGDTTMLIFLGKQYLDQRDKVDQSGVLEIGLILPEGTDASALKL